MNTVCCRNRRGFTLAELIMAIALLAFFSTMIVQVFARAHTVTLRAETLDRAVACAADLADQWKSAGEPQQPGPSGTVYLDEAFAVCPENEALYRADLSVQPGDTPHYWLLELSVIRLEGGLPADEEPVYVLRAGHCFTDLRGAP